MKFIIFLYIVTSISMLVALAANKSSYSSQFDNLVVVDQLRNSTFLKICITCFVGTRCQDNEALIFYKGILHEAIQQACAKCTTIQKILLKEFLSALKNDAPSGYFEVFKKKFDPEDKYLRLLMMPEIRVPARSVPETNVPEISVPANLPNPTYSGVHDYVDFDMVVENPILLKSWYNCFMDKDPCDRIQATFKSFLPQAIKQACARCTAKQKVILKKFISGLKERAPADYIIFKLVFDKDNKYLELLDKALA